MYNLLINEIKLYLSGETDKDKMIDILDNTIFDLEKKMKGYTNLIKCYSYINETKNQPAQKSLEWLKKRKSCLTASDVYKVIRCRDFKNNKTITELAKAKMNIDVTSNFTDNEATRWGERYENVAVLIFEKMMEVKVYEAALFIHPSNPQIGASCDGFIPFVDNAECIEIKCPFSREPKEGYIPAEYFHQMQTQLYVTNFDVCNFFDCKIEEWHNENDFKDDLIYFIQNGGTKGGSTPENPLYYGIIAQFVDIYNEKNRMVIPKYVPDYYKEESNKEKIPDEIDPKYNMAITPYYLYSKIINEDMSNYDQVKEELIRRVQETLRGNNMKFIRFIYWKPVKYMHTRIDRIPAWIETNGLKINAFWEYANELKCEYANELRNEPEYEIIFED